MKLLGSDTARVINEVTNAKIKIKEGEKVIDVCQAILDMKKDSYDDGMSNARKETAKKMLAAEKFSYEEIAAYFNLPISQIEKLAN